MEVFNPATPPTLDGYSETKTTNPRRAEFEGGYSQRSRSGPNPVGTEIDVTFEVPDPEKRSLDAFFTARGGAGAFQYQLPWDDVPLIWTVASWSMAVIGSRGASPMWRVRATFRREFDIV